MVICMILYIIGSNFECNKFDIDVSEICTKKAPTNQIAIKLHDKNLRNRKFSILRHVNVNVKNKLSELK